MTGTFSIETKKAYLDMFDAHKEWDSTWTGSAEWTEVDARLSAAKRAYWAAVDAENCSNLRVNRF